MYGHFTFQYDFCDMGHEPFALARFIIDGSTRSMEPNILKKILGQFEGLLGNYYCYCYYCYNHYYYHH